MTIHDNPDRNSKTRAHRMDSKGEEQRRRKMFQEENKMIQEEKREGKDWFYLAGMSWPLSMATLLVALLVL